MTTMTNSMSTTSMLPSKMSQLADLAASYLIVDNLAVISDKLEQVNVLDHKVTNNAPHQHVVTSLNAGGGGASSRSRTKLPIGSSLPAKKRALPLQETITTASTIDSASTSSDLSFMLTAPGLVMNSPNTSSSHSSSLAEQHQEAPPILPRKLKASDPPLAKKRKITSSSQNKKKPSSPSSTIVKDPSTTTTSSVPSCSSTPAKKSKIGPSSAKPKSKKNERPKDMPRHPLTAYNFFFSSERERILKSSTTTTTTMTSSSSESEDNNNTENYNLTKEEMKTRLLQHLQRRQEQKKIRRPHRKTHGKISFKELAILIGKRWRALPTNKLAYYHELAEMDKVNYREAMVEYRKKKEMMMLSSCADSSSSTTTSDGSSVPLEEHNETVLAPP